MAVNHLGESKKLGRQAGVWRRLGHHAQVGQGTPDCLVGQLRSARVVMLATLQRDGVATLAAHVLGGAHPVFGVGAEQACPVLGRGAGQARRDAYGVGIKPAFNDAPHPQA